MSSCYVNMYFLSYNEVNLNYFYWSNVRNFLFKQNLNFINFFQIEIPKVKLFFIYNKETELNKLKLYNNFILFWLMFGKFHKINKFNYRLERGIKYYKFYLNINLNKDIMILNFIDFFYNNITYYIRKNEKISSFLNNKYLFYLKNLEIFSNLRLSYNYYTTKMNDKLFIEYYYKKSLGIEKFLNKFKID